MAHFHAVVWADHQKATAWQFTSTEQTNALIHANDPHQRVRHFTAIDRMFSPGA